MKGESLFSAQFPPVLFSYWCFLNFADSTNIEAWNRLLLFQLLQLIVPIWGGGDVGGGERGRGGGDELKEQKYISSQTLNVTSRHVIFIFSFFW